jgi:hypothetical protein
LLRDPFTSARTQVALGAEFCGSLGKDGKTFTITGKVEHQACDKTTCYVPTSVPVKWQLQLFPLDRTQASVVIRHK